MEPGIWILLFPFLSYHSFAHQLYIVFLALMSPHSQNLKLYGRNKEVGGIGCLLPRWAKGFASSWNPVCASCFCVVACVWKQEGQCFNWAKDSSDICLMTSPSFLSYAFSGPSSKGTRENGWISGQAFLSIFICHFVFFGGWGVIENNRSLSMSLVFCVLSVVTDLQNCWEK